MALSQYLNFEWLENQGKRMRYSEKVQLVVLTFCSKCCATYHDSKTLNSKDVDTPPNSLPLSKIQKLGENLIQQQIAYKMQNTNVIFFLPNLSANGPVKVPKVDEDPNPAKNKSAIVCSAKP